MNPGMSSNVSLHNRKNLKLTGVKDIGRFDENTTIIFTNLGKMKVLGNSLKMEKFCIENGELEINGKIDSISYLDSNDSKGFWKNLFK